MTKPLTDMTDAELDALMTVENQTAHIRRYFEHLFGVPAGDIEVAFNDDETIVVTDLTQTDDYRWVFEIPSDDDGHYYFRLDGELAPILMIPYPTEVL